MSRHCNRIRLALCLVLLAGAAGCASNIRRAGPVDVTLPAGEQLEVVISRRDRDRYDEAIELLKSGELSRAQANLEALQAEAPFIPGVSLNLALIQYQKRDYALARAQLDEALRLSPRNPLAHNLDGSLLRREGRFKEAQVAYAKALKIDPEYPEAHFNMAVLFDIYLQYWIDAREHYRRYQKLAPAPDRRVESWLRDLEARIKVAGG